MPNAGSLALSTGALFSISAAVAHLACIAVGPQAYRFMGAGEKMARAAEAGSIRPAVITLLIAGVLFIWGAYALSGAGIIRELPFTRPALVSICTGFCAAQASAISGMIGAPFASPNLGIRAVM